MDAPTVQNMTDIHRRASTGSVVKKDGFRVPQQPPATRVKQRTIAPSNSAPTMSQQKSNVVQQNTFLAQLLMTGNNILTMQPNTVIFMPLNSVQPVYDRRNCHKQMLTLVDFLL